MKLSEHPRESPEKAEHVEEPAGSPSPATQAHAATPGPTVRRRRARSANRRRRSRRPLLSRAEKGLAVFGAVIGALAGLVALVDWVRSLGTDPPREIDARIERVVQGSGGESLRDYLNRTRQPVTQYSNVELDQLGYVFNVSVRLMGELDKQLPLRWSLYRRPDERLRAPTYNQIAGRLKPRSQDHASTWPVWVPYPPDDGTYFVRFTLEDTRKRPVSELDSRPFHYSPRRSSQDH